MEFIIKAAIAALVVFGVLYALSGYLKREYNFELLGQSRRIISIVEGIALILTLIIGAMMQADEIIPAILIVWALFSVFFTLHGLKYTSLPGAILTGVLQAYVSLFAGVILIFLSGAKSSSSTQAFKPAVMDPLCKSTLERADFVARTTGYFDAEDWAKKNGYENAEDAYKNGFFNGKL